MAIVSDVEIRLRADIARLQEDLNRARGQVDNAMERIRTSVNTAAKAFALLAAGMAAGAFAQWIKGAIDATDVVSDLSQKTGIAIKDIGGLQLWFQKGGTEAGAFESSMIKLSRKIADGGDEFTKLGIKTRDVGGGLRSNVDVLLDSADAFAAMQDGTAKTALAIELFGKTGADLIPLLNEGSDGLREMQEMAEKLGLTFDEETVNAAGNFNDTLDFMAGALQGVARQAAAQMLPVLNSISGAFLKLITEGNGVREAADVIGTGFKLIYTAGVLITQVFSVAGKTIGMLAGQLVSLFQMEFKQAMNIGHAWQADMKETFTSTAASISDVWTGAGGAVVEALVKTQHAGAVTSTAAAKDAKKQENAFRSLIDAAQAKITASDREAKGLDKLTDSQQMAMALDKALADGKLTLTASEEGFYRALIETIGANEEASKANERAKESAEQVQKAVDDLNASRQKALEDATKEAEASEALVATYGMTKGAIEELEAARLRDRLSQRQSLELDEAEVAQLEALIAAKNRSAMAKTQLGGMEEAKKAGEELANFLDPSKAQEFGDTLAKAFGRAGTAMGQLSSTFQAFAAKQTSFAKARENLEKKHSGSQRDEKAYIADLSQLEKKRFTEQLGGYGDMAGAAAGFFNEQSKGYQIVSGLSQAFHAAELASTIAELVPKGISAVLGQGQGDPYTALPRMAAMAAFVAALGVSIGGSGGASVSVSKQRQEANGTGTVLGDSSAKSESLARALEMVEDNTYRNLSVNYDMLAALRNIESSLSGLGNLIVRSAGITGELPADKISSAQALSEKYFLGSLGEKLTGGAMGKVLGSIFGGKVTSLDTGLTANAASLASIMAGGLNASQYNDTKKSGGWFSSDKYRTETTALDNQINDQFTKVILSMAEGVKASAAVLGVSGDAFSQRLASFVVDIGKISLTGLKGDEIQEALESAFSKMGDDLASYAISGLTEFQKVGEGTYETLVRIANDYATVDAVLSSFGKSFGSVGLASVAARENLIELAGGLDEFTSQGSFFLENFFSDAEKEATLRTAVYAQLDKVAGGSTTQTVAQFKALVLAQDLTTQSGRDAYASLMSISQAFIDLDKYAEDAAVKAKELAATRQDLEIQLMEASGDAAGALAASRQLELASLDESLRPLQALIYARQDEADSLATAAATAASKRQLEIRLMDLSGDKAGALAARRQIELAALDESLRPLQELIYAREDLNELETKAAQLLASRQNVEIQILEAQGQSSAALAMRRQIELAAMDESLRPLYLRLYALQDEETATAAATKAEDDLTAARQKAAQTALSALQRAVNAEKDLVTTAYQDSMADLEKYIDDINGSIENTRELSQSLRQALGGLTVNSSAATTASRQVAQDQITMALKTARASGGLPTAAELAGALSTLGQTSADDYGSYLEYVKATARSAGDIAALNGLTENQLSIEERQLALLVDQQDAETLRYNAEIERLDKFVVAAQQQVDAIMGVDNTVLSVYDAITRFSAAITGAPITSTAYTATTPWVQTNSSAQPSDTMGSGSAMEVWGKIEKRMENMERYLLQVSDQFDQVTEGGNAMRTVEA